MHEYSIPLYNVYVLQFRIFGRRNQGQVPAERQKKTVNPMLKGYGSTCREEKKTLGIPRESKCPGPDESCLWNNNRAIFSKKKNPGHVHVLKSRNKEFFHLWNYFLNKIVARQTINAG
jgi:hypothetical protein